MDRPTAESAARNWHKLDETEQTALLEEYGHYLDKLPPSCSIQTKDDRFKAWLLQRDILYLPDKS